jgi:hypothetical protein
MREWTDLSVRRHIAHSYPTGQQIVGSRASVNNEEEDDLKDLVTLIGSITPDTGIFSYRAITPHGEYSVRNLGDCWSAVQLSDRAGRATARGSTPEDAVRKALTRQALAA